MVPSYQEIVNGFPGFTTDVAVPPQEGHIMMLRRLQSNKKHVRVLSIPGLDGSENIDVGCRTNCKDGCVYGCC